MDFMHGQLSQAVSNKGIAIEMPSSSGEINPRKFISGLNLKTASDVFQCQPMALHCPLTFRARSFHVLASV